jgi:hypothetical protein
VDDGSSNPDGAPICEDCSQHYVTDEVTDEMIHEDDAVQAIHYGRNHHSRYGFRYGEYEVITLAENTQYINGTRYTDDAVSELFSDCERCGCTLHQDEQYSTDCGDGPYCSDCMPGDVSHYGKGSNINPSQTTYAVCTSRRSYGVELELADAADCSRDNESLPYVGRFGCKDDGSISCDNDQGAEFVSPILYGDDGFAVIDRFCRVARSTDPNDSCGFHLHVGITDLSDFQKCQLVRLLTKVEKVARMLVPSWRSRNTYCNSELEIDADREYHDFRAIINDDRYSAFNFQSYHTHGTVEIRLHHATNSATEVKNWVKLFTAIVDYVAADGSLDNFAGSDQRIFNQLTRLAGREIADYYAERAEANGYSHRIKKEAVTFTDDCPGQLTLQFA